MPFDPKIPREFANKMGREAMQIIELGLYATPTSRQVDIAEDIAEAVARTTHLPPDHRHTFPRTGEHATVIEVTEETSLAAARRHVDAGLRTVVLNFASPTVPGGGFLAGERAQEEYHCRSTALFACQADGPMYAFHLRQANALRSDAMIYSPDVPVFRGDDHELLEEPFKVAFVSAAACDARDVAPLDQPKIAGAMGARIVKVLAAAQANGHDALVLGAWGCGNFANDPALIADLFRQALQGPFHGAFRRVTFAVIDTSPERRCLSQFRLALGQKASPLHN
ncbi:MAG: TIGR02452 family protein [Verrucomicrobia bacterium]|nr:TIGR02452 family protein [Verrucomicrobiota bacterium]